MSRNIIISLILLFMDVKTSGESTSGTGSSQDWDHCSETFPCDEGEGDCDFSAHCKTGLYCNDNANNCKDFHGLLADEYADCCTNKRFDGMIVGDDTISSYNFPKHYVNEIDELHTIIVPPGMKLFLAFSEFDLEAADNCEYDFLRINDDSGKQIFFNCGTDWFYPFEILLESEIDVTINFRTDWSVTRSGFKLHYKIGFTSPGYCVNSLGDVPHTISVSITIETPIKTEKECVLICLEQEGATGCVFGRRNWIVYANQNLDANYCAIHTEEVVIGNKDHTNFKYTSCYVFEAKACCGFKKKDKRIIAGFPTEANKYPWIVSLKNKESLPDMALASALPGVGNKQPVFCAGTLVAAEWVITAAHCVARNKKDDAKCLKQIPKEPHQETQCHDLRGVCKRNCGCEPEGKIVPDGCPLQMDAECCVPNILKPGDFIVTIGEHDLTKPTASTLTLIVSEVIPHPEYLPNGYSNDIALLKLKDPVNLSVYTPACLPNRGADFTGKTAHIYGWGRTGVYDPPSKYLLEATQTIISDDECRTFEPSHTMSFDAKTMVCAIYKPSQTIGNSSQGLVIPGQQSIPATCNGDSGGPMTVEGPLTKQHILVGVVSWGYSCGQVTPATKVPTPSYFAKVANFRQFLDEYMLNGATFCHAQ